MKYRTTFAHIIMVAALVISFLPPAAAQDDNRLHRMIQREGTEAMIRRFFSNTGIAFRTDTVYMLLLRPMSCPRCEGTISPLIGLLKEAGCRSDILLSVFYPKERAVRKYIGRRNFPAEYSLISTDDSLLNAFSFTGSSLSVPFLAKFNVKTGDLILSTSLLGLSVNADNAAGIVRRTRNTDEKAPPATPEEDRAIPSVYKADMFTNIAIVRLKDTDEHALSKVNSVAYSPSGSLASATDDLTLSVYVYDAETGDFVAALNPTEKEMRQYISDEVSEKLYNYLVSSNILNAMYFRTQFTGDSSLTIAASLPRVFFEGEDDLAYYNHVTFVEKHCRTGALSAFRDVEDNPDTTLTLAHTDALFDDEGDRIYIPLSKGWPTSGTTMLDSSVAAHDNPFEAIFYENVPLFAIYDRQGSYLADIGLLDNLYRRHSLGYLYARPHIRRMADGYWVTCGNTGTIYRYPSAGSGAPDDSIVIFRPEIADRRPGDYDAPLSYLLSFGDDLKSSIRDYVSAGGTLYVLVSEGPGRFYVVPVTGRQPGGRQYLPPSYKGARLRHVNLAVPDGRLTVRCIYESAAETYCIRYW